MCVQTNLSPEILTIEVTAYYIFSWHIIQRSLEARLGVTTTVSFRNILPLLCRKITLGTFQCQNVTLSELYSVKGKEYHRRMGRWSGGFRDK